MKRSALIWLPFAAFVALTLGALGWMTRTVLLLDQAQARATAAAQVEENVRLALWRMDGALAPILTPEIARPYFEYSPVFPAERAYTRMYTELAAGDVLVPSPLLRTTSPYILLHFQVEPDGKITSPQAPAGNVRKIAQARYTTAAEIEQAERRLLEIARVVKAPNSLAMIPPPREAEEWRNNKIRVAANGSIASNYGAGNREPVQLQPQQQSGGQGFNNAFNSFANSGQTSLEQQAKVQELRGQQEYAVRKQTQYDNNDLVVGNNTNPGITPGVGLGAMTPAWIGDTLILARHVSINGKTYTQGCLLDWPAMRKWLLESAADLVPDAQLVAVSSVADDAQPRRLASIPVRLDLSPASIFNPPSSLSLNNPTAVTLLIAWIGVLLACAAVALLLRGVIALSQRRAGFVSAVTHELRTPLTTLRMYTEMLADNMVPDEERKAAYLKTLRVEANRLGHLVDNVLLYSRLERSSRDTRVERAALADLLDRLVPRLADRAAQAGMALGVNVADNAGDARLRANLLSVEQILFNLVDNACKYAAAASDRTMQLNIERHGGRLIFRLADHGPGLDANARARLFQPFSKSVHEAADSAPGLGLGLALSHRLARNMNAELRLDSSSAAGTTFVLTLPLE